MEVGPNSLDLAKASWIILDVSGRTAAFKATVIDLAVCREGAATMTVKALVVVVVVVASARRRDAKANFILTIIIFVSYDCLLQLAFDGIFAEMSVMLLHVCIRAYWSTPVRVLVSHTV